MSVTHDGSAVTVSSVTHTNVAGTGGTVVARNGLGLGNSVDLGGGRIVKRRAVAPTVEVSQRHLTHKGGAGQWSGEHAGQEERRE